MINHKKTCYFFCIPSFYRSSKTILTNQHVPTLLRDVVFVAYFPLSRIVLQRLQRMRVNLPPVRSHRPNVPIAALSSVYAPAVSSPPIPLPIQFTPFISRHLWLGVSASEGVHIGVCFGISKILSNFRMWQIRS